MGDADGGERSNPSKGWEQRSKRAAMWDLPDNMRNLGGEGAIACLCFTYNTQTVP